MKYINLKDEMINTILEGRKTQTRIVIKPQPDKIINKEVYIKIGVKKIHDKSPAYNLYGSIKCPFGKVGDKLWVKETWYNCGKKKNNELCIYKVDYGNQALLEINTKWKSSISMPRWASRITLEITNIRVERLQEITSEDALKEGIDIDNPAGISPEQGVEIFSELWNSIHKKEHCWEDNPWVWVIEFQRTKINDNKKELIQ